MHYMPDYTTCVITSYVQYRSTRKNLNDRGPSDECNGSLHVMVAAEHHLYNMVAAVHHKVSLMIGWSSDMCSAPLMGSLLTV